VVISVPQAFELVNDCITVCSADYWSAFSVLLVGEREAMQPIKIPAHHHLKLSFEGLTRGAVVSVKSSKIITSVNSYHVWQKTIKNNIGRHRLTKNGHQLQSCQLAITILQTVN